MSQMTSNFASEETFPYFNEKLVTPLIIGGLGVELLEYTSSPARGAKNLEQPLPKGFSKQEFHSPKEVEAPQEPMLEIGYVHDMELSR